MSWSRSFYRYGSFDWAVTIQVYGFIGSIIAFLLCLPIVIHVYIIISFDDLNFDDLRSERVFSKYDYVNDSSSAM